MGFLDRVQAAAKAFVGDTPGTAPAAKPAVAPASAPVAPAAAAQAARPAIAPAVAPATAPSAAPEARAIAAAEVGHDTQADLARAASDQQLGVLRRLIEGKVGDFIKPFKLSGKTFSGDVPNNDLNFATDANKKDLKRKIADCLKDLSLEQFKAAFPTLGESLSLDDVKNLFAEMCAAQFLKEAEAEFKKQYEYFAVFMEKNPKYEFIYQIAINEFGNKTNSFKSNPADFDAKYEVLKKEKEAEKEKDKQAKTPEAAQADADEIARAGAIEKSWLGGLLKTLGIVKVDEASGKADFTSVVNGSNWLGGMVVGLFGGSHLLSDSTAYADMVAGLDPKYKGLLEGIEKKARTSPFALKDKKAAAPVAAQQGQGESQEGGPEMVYDKVDKRKFALFVSRSETLPEKGIELNENYTVERGKVLRVDLSHGEIIVPKGSTLNLDGESDQSAIAADISLKDRTLRIEDAIPTGTIFKGKPTFELV